jgi:hypothetical protein
VASGWTPFTTATSRGSGLATSTATTVAGTTLGLEIPNAPVEWITPPIDSDITISGAITGNIWASESNMSANVAINFVVDKIAATDGAITEIVKSARTIELAVLTRAVNNFTATPGAGVSCLKGDRLRIRIFGDDAGTMAASFTFDLGYNGTTAAADGDTYIEFNETFDFQTTDPTGTTLYPTSTASDVATADVDREMWTSRGSSAGTNVRNVPNGWTVPLQVTDVGGGTPVSWFSKQLQAFTLSGLIKVNLRVKESNIAANASVGVEIARVDSDGTNPVVWGYANKDATVVGNAGELPTSELVGHTVYVSGADLVFTDGQRLRLRFFADDCADVPTVTANQITVYYNGPTGGASGDTFLILPQTVTEFTGGGAATSLPVSRIPRRASLTRI